MSERVNINQNNRIARNTIWMSVRMVIVLFINLYTTRIILEALGVVDYGVYNVVAGFVTLFGFITTSLSNGIQRFYNFEMGKNGIIGARNVFHTSMIVQLILVVVILLLTETVGLWYVWNKMVIPPQSMNVANWLFQTAVFSFILTILQTPFVAAIMANERMDFFAIINVVDSFLKLCIAFSLSLFSGKLIAYGILLLILSCGNFIAYCWYCKSKFKEITFRIRFHKAMFKSIMVFSGWNLFGSFSNIMKEQGINLVLNLFFGPVVNAARGVAAQVNNGLQSFVTNLTIPVRPQVVQSYAAGNIQRSINLTYTISKLSFFFLFILSLPVIYETDFILNFWLGKDVPQYTSAFVKIIILISFLNNLNAAISGIVHATGKMRLYQLSTSFTALSCIPLAYIFLKKGFPPTTALWTVFVTMLIAQAVAIIVLKHLIRISIREYFIDVVYPIIKAVISTAWIPYITHLFLIEGWVRLITDCIVTVFLITPIIYAIGLSSKERELFNSMLISLKRKFINTK